MKNYEKPMIQEEEIILEDIMAVSQQDEANEDNIDKASIFDLFPKE